MQADASVNVVFGPEGLKIHSKIIDITPQERNRYLRDRGPKFC